jgi:hypothetical protein
MKIENSEFAEWKQTNSCIACQDGFRVEDLFYIEFGKEAWGNFCKNCIIAIHSITSPLSVLVNTGKDIYEGQPPQEQDKGKVS